LKACLAAGVAGHGIVVSTAFGDRLGASKNPDEHGLQIVNASPLG